MPVDLREAFKRVVLGGENPRSVLTESPFTRSAQKPNVSNVNPGGNANISARDNDNEVVQVRLDKPLKLFWNTQNSLKWHGTFRVPKSQQAYWVSIKHYVTWGSPTKSNEDRRERSYWEARFGRFNNFDRLYPGEASLAVLTVAEALRQFAKKERPKAMIFKDLATRSQSLKDGVAQELRRLNFDVKIEGKEIRADKKTGVFDDRG